MTAQALVIENNFERSKNLKALTITLVVCLLIFLFMILQQWVLPKIEQPVVMEGIEVNLGDSETGLGNIEPQIPGEPSVNSSNTSTPPTGSEQNATNIPNDDANDEVATTIPKTVTNPKPVTSPVKNNATPTPVTPKPATPKAVYGGGTKNNTGGNNADSYNNSKNQGIAGGNGNQGNPNGNPNSDSYNGNSPTGHGGVQIKSGLGGRRITKQPSFEDDFNQNAKVAVDITVDANGKVTGAIINLRGTANANTTIRSIAIRKAFQLKFNAATEEQSGTVVFDFKVTQ